ncbi:hypothetical protein NPS53_08625 [Pseudomonas putida]|uniref:hypothetical protein n=1 Tax=Pseudomonas putida TaxID=303 RepID=UPI002363EEFF|nr:hypothetical protein [Pseudomonas putida]MDD2139637.1 hypothetical protein [Pseudomonas putida]HDS1721560.1 hypothetical protein [Pseudomonas putida]
MWDYAGLFCLVAGIGAFFALWLMTIGNRSKQVESDTGPVEHQAAPEHLMRQAGYSLSPEHKRHASEAAKQAPAPAVTEHVPLGESDTDTRTQVDLELEDQDATAANHLEMASLFFNMGDFEGVMEMCQLVLDNHSASKQQIDMAHDLKARCA